MLAVIVNKKEKIIQTKAQFFREKAWHVPAA
jgi:hypothetical protein